MANRFKKTAVELLVPTNVEINGSRPWDIRVFDERFYH